MRKGFVAVGIVVVLLGMFVPVGAHPIAEHGMPQGLERLKFIQRQPAGVETIKENFDLVGRLKLRGKAPEGDVFYYHRGKKHTAYLGTFAVPCTDRGVNIVDVRDPAEPRLLSDAALAAGGVSYEDVVVVRIGDRDVLATGTQVCGDGGKGGLALFDVTQPRRPEKLALLRTSGGGVHELDVAIRPDGTVLALLAVPFASDEQGDFQIADITNPNQPKRVGGWSILADSTFPIPSMSDPALPLGEITERTQGKGDTPAIFGHNVKGADEGMTAYVSHWDAGVLKFDISDPSTPVLVARTTAPFDEEVDAHSTGVFEVDGRRYLLQNAEDFMPSSPVHISSDETGSNIVGGSQQIWMLTRLDAVGPVTGEMHDAGDGCQATDYEGAEGKVVLADSSHPFDGAAPCSPAEQVFLASAADPAALLLSATGTRRPNTFWAFPFGGPEEVFELEGLPVVVTWGGDGLAESLRTAPGADPVEITLDPQTPAWGSLTIFDESQATDGDGDGVAEMAPVGGFSGVSHVTGDEAYTIGTWSIHNTEVMGDRVYAAWYSNGIVALDMSDPTAPGLVGQYSNPSLRRDQVFDQLEGGGEFASTWGVAVDPERGLVYASDMRLGLWILRPTGPAAPTG